MNKTGLAVGVVMIILSAAVNDFTTATTLRDALMFIGIITVCVSLC